jgi:4-hydroxybenzoate polyprenyltransferase
MSHIAKDIIVSMRPKHWVKNSFIFAGLIFSKHLFEANLLIKVSLGFVFFGLAASCIYVINDILDVDRDREHPKKRNRPLAAGRLPVRVAWIASGCLMAVSMACAFALDVMFFGILVIYLIANVLYSARLKDVVIIDVMIISFGFALRVFAGTTLASVRPSDWLIICTIALSLFLGFTKRRHELMIMGESANDHRKVLGDYSITFLDQMITVACSCAVMSYALYTVAEETVARFGTRDLVFTLPFVLYGIYRYLYLTHQKQMSGNPTNTLLADMPLLLTGLLWLLTVVVIIY